MAEPITVPPTAVVAVAVEGPSTTVWTAPLVRTAGPAYLEFRPTASLEGAEVIGYGLGGVLRALSDKGRPAHVVDLEVEARLYLNGRMPRPSSFAAACATLGLRASRPLPPGVLDAMTWSARALPVGEWSHVDDECLRLLRAMHARLSTDSPAWATRHHRGCYLAALAAREARGLPVDAGRVRDLDEAAGALLRAARDKSGALVALLGRLGAPHAGAMRAYVAELPGAWTRTPSGGLALDHRTLEKHAALDPRLLGLAQAVRLGKRLTYPPLRVSPTGRTHLVTNPFAATTSRDTGSSTKNLPDRAAWHRQLIAPPAGRSILACDWTAQDIGSAASLASDERMWGDYVTGDPYTVLATWAIEEGIVDGTPRGRRSMFKWVALAPLYGMGVDTLAANLGVQRDVAERIMSALRERWARFFSWRDAFLEAALLEGEVVLPWGWRVRVARDTKLPSLMNFPVQASGAEMLRRACVALDDALVDVVHAHHDAVWVECDSGDEDETERTVLSAMAEASQSVLYGARLLTKTSTVRAGGEWAELEDDETWKFVSQELGW